MPTVAEHLIDQLDAQGVRRIYGIPGDSLNGLTDALRVSGRIEWIHHRHEEAAAFAAAAEAAVPVLAEAAARVGRLGALRCRDLDAVADELPGIQIDDSGLDTGSADVHSDRTRRIRCHTPQPIQPYGRHQ